MIGVATKPKVRPDRADRANLADLWAWAFGGRDVIGIDEQLRDIKRELRVQTCLVVFAVLACNPVTVHLVQPLLKGLH